MFLSLLDEIDLMDVTLVPQMFPSPCCLCVSVWVEILWTMSAIFLLPQLARLKMMVACWRFVFLHSLGSIKAHLKVTWGYILWSTQIGHKYLLRLKKLKNKLYKMLFIEYRYKYINSDVHLSTSLDYLLFSYFKLIIILVISHQKAILIYLI